MADYNFRDFWTDFDILVGAIARRLLQANDEFGNPHMRKAILDNLNEMLRFSAGKFVLLGILTEDELKAYYRVPKSEGATSTRFDTRASVR